MDGLGHLADPIVGSRAEALGATREALDAYTRARQVGRLDPRVRDYITQRSAALQAPRD